MTRLRSGRRKYYDVFSRFYDSFIKLHSRNFRDETREFLVDSACLVNKTRPKILDVCCGTGSVIHFFAGRYPYSLAVGYDFSHGMLLQASKKDVSHRLRLIEGDAAVLPFGENVFDTVCCSHALYELKGPVRKLALLEMRRVVKPNGLVLIMEHEVPKKALIRALFYMRLSMMGFKDASEFLKRGPSYFEEIFSEVTLKHTPSGKSKLYICRK